MNEQLILLGHLPSPSRFRQGTVRARPRTPAPSLGGGDGHLALLQRGRDPERRQRTHHLLSRRAATARAKQDKEHVAGSWIRVSRWSMQERLKCPLYLQLL